MKLIILNPYPLEGSTRYRTYNWVAPLQKIDVQSTVHSYMDLPTYQRRMYIHPRIDLKVSWGLIKGGISRIKILSENRKDATFLIHRQAFPFFHTETVAFLKNFSYILDFDDAIFTQYNIIPLLKHSKAVIVGNSYLANYAKQHTSSPVYIIPTVVDTEKYKPTPKIKNEKLQLGWIGTGNSYKQYLEPLLSRLVDLCNKLNAEITVVGSENMQASVEKHGANFVLWTLEKEVENINQFDIGLMPLRNDEYVLGKCAFKLIEYGALGLPSIGSDIGANNEVLVHNTTGFLAKNEEEFLFYTETLLRNHNLRQSMGLAARQHIVKHFSTDAQLAKWHEILKPLGFNLS